MRKKTRLLSLLIAVPLLFASCVSTSTLVWDDKIPETETAIVYWWWGVMPTVYNGVPIEGRGARSSWESKITVLPAGDMEIELNLDARLVDREVSGVRRALNPSSGEYSLRYKGRGFVFKYHLNPGTEYIVMFGRNEKNHWGVNVYNEPPPAVANALSYPSTEEDIVEFVPFIKQPRHIKPLLFGGSEAEL